MTDRSGALPYGRQIFDWLLNHEKHVDAISFALIFISIVVFSVGTGDGLAKVYSAQFYLINMVILMFFAVEFLLRISVFNHGVQVDRSGGLRGWFKRNAFLIFDFIAFFPELLLLLLGIEFIEFLKVLRLLRILKLARYFPALKIVLDVLRSCYKEVFASFLLGAIVWYLASLGLYGAERYAQPEYYGTIWQSMWRSLIIMTKIGQSNIFPVTPLGKFASSFISIIGFGIVALPSGIIAGQFMDVLRRSKSD